MSSHLPAMYFNIDNGESMCYVVLNAKNRNLGKLYGRPDEELVEYEKHLSEINFGIECAVFPLTTILGYLVGGLDSDESYRYTMALEVLWGGGSESWKPMTIEILSRVL